MGKMEKNRKENPATKVTKIPRTKRRKYGMNKTQVYRQIQDLPYQQAAQIRQTLRARAPSL